MNNQVNIHISGVQRELGDEPIIEQATGQYTYQNKKHYIRYNNEGVNNTLVISDDEVTIRKTGAVESRMTFRRNASTDTPYRTEQGIIDLDIFTETMQLETVATSISPEDIIQITLNMVYRLSMNGQHLSTNELKITIQ